MEANGHAAPESASEDHEATHEAAAESHTNEAVTVAATVGVVAVGAALFEVALLPGIALGVAAMLAPKYVPKMGEAVAPMFRSSVRGARLRMVRKSLSTRSSTEPLAFTMLPARRPLLRTRSRTPGWLFMNSRSLMLAWNSLPP